MTRTVIPAIPWWAPPLAAVLAIVLILKHGQWLLFLPVVLFVLWEIAHNLELTLRAVGGDRSGTLGPFQVVVATLLGLALAVCGWWLLTLAYAASCAARWYATGGRSRR
jgi:hypothetical protein